MEWRAIPVATVLGILALSPHASADEPMVNPVMWGSGVTLVAAGSVATLTGLTVAAVTSICFVDCDHTTRDIGDAVLVGGLSAIALGVVFVVIGGAPRTAVAFVPTPSPHGGGLSLVARF